MDKKTKILLIILTIFVIWSISMTYYRTMVARDFYTEQSEEEVIEEEEIIDEGDVIEEVFEEPIATTTEEILE